MYVHGENLRGSEWIPTTSCGFLFNRVLHWLHAGIMKMRGMKKANLTVLVQSSVARAFDIHN